MSYQWTAEQRARLVPGARLGGRHVVIGPAWLVGDHWRVDVESWHKGLYLENVDPSALRPPTLAWLRSMARRKLGPCIIAREPDGCLHVYTGRKDCHDSCAYFAGTPHLDAHSSCALWISSLPEVTP